MDLLNVCLQGKVTIMTGARRGIGKALALGFARAGAHIALCDHVVEDGLMEDVAREIKDSGLPSLAMQADVTKITDVDRMVQQTIEQLGGINILINNAGMIPRATPLEISEEMWDTVMAVNLKGCLLCSQGAAKRMIEQQRCGSIIHISSIAGIEANVNRAGYASSKAGLRIIFGKVRKGPSVIRKGVFGVVRHPIYLSEVLLYLGLFLLTMSLAAGVAWIAASVFLYYLSWHEERLLLERFGEAYASYMGDVGMWIPRSRKR
ncbi:MAG: SDR family NAD(P)-dependent oxidoreductase [Deltaproteobacteria bacterium]|nr:SDR family NAD(P)-dependent oxidoreductase [Deltaproteobacteria bacterium]